jgi:hypothetical protein
MTVIKEKLLVSQVAEDSNLSNEVVNSVQASLVTAIHGGPRMARVLD